MGRSLVLAPSLDGEVELAVQAQPLGTADAVRAAVGHLDEAQTVIVLNGDVPLIGADAIAALAQAHERSGAAATIATVTLDDPSGYGRVVRAPDGTVERVVESKAPGDATELELHIREVNTGMFAFEAPALIAALTEVRAENAQGEHYLPDVLAIMRAHERSVLAHELPDADTTLQVNDRRQLAEVRAVLFSAGSGARHMLAGVTIVDPAATVIDATVQIGPDTVIAPFTSLHGTTRDGIGCLGGYADPSSRCRDLATRTNVVQATTSSGAENRRARQRRPVRLPATGDDPAGRLEGRHVRRGQELRHRPRDQGAPPVLHR